MIYRYIYKITCTTGSFKGKFYYGQHTTEDLNDGYKGSGIKLRDYYKKHPNDYIKEIIAFYNSEEDLNQAEYDIIHPWLNKPMCLNLMEGGESHSPSIETRQKISNTEKGKPSKKKGIKTGKPAWNRGLKTPDETRKKISNATKGRTAWNKGLKLESTILSKNIDSVNG